MKQKIYKDFGRLKISTDNAVDIFTITDWIIERRIEGAKSLDFTIAHDEDIECRAYDLVLETDEQYNARIEIQKEAVKTYQHRKEEKDRKEYERLKAIYGDG